MNILTHSAVNTFDTCKKMYQYRYVIGIKRPEDPEALIIGKIVHDGIEMHLQGKTAIDVQRVIREKYRPIECDGTQETFDKHKEQEYTIAKAIGIVAAYFNHYGENRLTPIETEKTFEIPLQRITDKGNTGTSRKFTLSGVRDAIVEDAEGNLYLMEHKTTSDKIDEPVYWQRLNVDNQVSLYWKAAIQAGYNIKSILYNVISKPALRPKEIPLLDLDGLKIVLDTNRDERVYNANGKPRQTADKDKGFVIQTRPETSEEFTARVALAMLAEPERYFERRKIARLENDLAISEQDYWFAANLINQCEANGYYPRSTGACMKWGRACPYLDICSTGGYAEGDPIPNGFVKAEPHEELNNNQ